MVRRKVTSLKNRKKGSMAGKHSEGSYGEKKREVHKGLLGLV